MNIEVTKDEVIIDKNSDKPHENEYNITQCYFTFDDFIESFQVKRAIFTIVSTGEMYETDIINHTCETPIEVLKHEYETIKLGVYGYNIGENDELVNRFSPSYDTFVVPTGSYQEGALSPEPITPSQYDLYSQALQEGLQEVDDKIDEVVETVDGKIEEVDAKLGEVDDKLEVVDGKIEDIDDAIESTNEAIERTNNLNLDVSDKVDGDVTVTLTKKDASTKTVILSDGTSLEFNWDGTKLGIKTSDEEEYTYVDLQGIQGPAGPQGEAFRIKKTYSSVAEMNADFNNMEYGDYVMIASSVEVEDNAKLYTRGESQWIFITDFSGATGIRGPVGATPSIQIGTVVSGSTPSVTRTGTDENPVLNFVLQKGDKGDKGNIGDTGNGISSIEKTSTSGLVDTYTITYTNGNTTTFDVSNGNGIDRIEKTATVGNKDTYTIYFTNGSTTTYEVSNGEVTREELEEEVERLSMIYNAFPSTTGEVEEGSINGTAEVPFKEIGLKGNTSQESTTGKNLFDNTGTNETVNSVTFTINSDKSVSLSGTSSADITKVIGSFTGTNGTTYCLSGSSGSSSTYYLNLQGVINQVGTSNTFTGDGTAHNLRIYIKSGVNVSGVIIKPMIETGSTATNYEPYTGGNPAPNPDYPYPVNVVTGDNTINITSKDALQGITLISGYINSNDEVATATGWKHSDYIDITDCDYYIVDSNQGQNPKSIIYNANKQPIQVINLNNNIKKTYDLKSYTGAKYLRISCTETSLLTQHLIAQTDYNVNLGTLELCKIGDYQDYIYKENGNWYKYGAIGKTIFTGTGFSRGNQTENYTSYYIIINDMAINKSLVSNYFTNYPISDIQTPIKEGIASHATLNRIYISLTNDKTVATWLSAHNTTVYYVLATPTITEITDTTLIEQLDNLEKAYSYDTQTNISQTNQDKPFIISYEAILSLKNVLNS